MNRTIKALGLAFVVMLVIGALGASAAQAIVITDPGGTYPNTITGEGKEIGEEFRTEGGAVKCEKSNYDGVLTESSSTLTVHPVYTNCQAFGFLEATIETTGCDYVFHATEHESGTATFRAHVDVECEAGKVIKVSAATCKLEIGAQTGLTTVDITNMKTEPTSNSDITVKATLQAVNAGERDGRHGPIKYTVTQDGFLCPFSGTGAKTGGEYSTVGYITVVNATGGGLEIAT